MVYATCYVSHDIYRNMQSGLYKIKRTHNVPATTTATVRTNCNYSLSEDRIGTNSKMTVSPSDRRNAIMNFTYLFHLDSPSRYCRWSRSVTVPAVCANFVFLFLFICQYYIMILVIYRCKFKAYNIML